MPKEAIWPVGFIVGAILGSLVARSLEIDGIIRLIATAGMGVVGGIVADLLAKKTPTNPSGSIGPR
jgi:uncharacterized membrane protein YeiH